jgi:hypothetical protein
MPGKIFISYRRDDSSAAALSICQYLEREFGRKNVFIDVDLEAGARFSEVLESRLSSCKVLLAIIGPQWLDVLDDMGSRRLDHPNDWVRVEIARALKRDITVIPVCVSGANLPEKDALPTDIQALVDHQAAAVSTRGFRAEMAGLVRDIRAIPSTGNWKRIGGAMGAMLAALILILLITRLFFQGNVDTTPEQVRYCVTKDRRWCWVPGATDNVSCTCDQALGGIVGGQTKSSVPDGFKMVR